jgi:hypothetical protein
MRLQDKYLHVSKRDRVISLLKDQKDSVLTIEILEFLRVNPKYWKKIKEIKDLQIMVWNLMVDREEIEQDIEVDKSLLRYYDEQMEKKKKQLGLPSKY